jgi:DNA-binding NarL/FixJ family response regulator
MGTPIRVAIADDHALFRTGLKVLLQGAGMMVVAETNRADDVAPMITRAPCDVLLLDVQMERNALGDITRLAARVKVIAVTADEPTEFALAAMRLGARAVVSKHFEIETLVAVIGAVVGGQIWMPPALQAHIAGGLRHSDTAPLTRREREVVRYAALGLRNAEIGQKLRVTEQTVKTHLNNVFKKVGVRDRVELAMYAIRLGVVAVHERPS